LALLLAGLALVFATGLHRYLTFAALCAQREALLAEVARLGVVAALAYIGLYTLVAGLSVPGATILTLAGGFVFGAFAATAYTVIGATLGAIGVFLAARTAFGDLLQAKVGGTLWRLEEGFKENALSYLLVLRLIPLFPFWLVNLVPAFLGVPLGVFALGTFVGIIPGTFVYASLGSGLGGVVEECEAPGLEVLTRPEVLLPILALAVIALLPVIYKRIKARRDGEAADLAEDRERE
jgi:uncharacterized membrane protein YdjX (TVP38/TMEM64 family)